MSKAGSQIKQWSMLQRQPGRQILARLVAYWEVNSDPISDDYTPSETGANELLQLWVQRLGRTSGLVEIYRFVNAVDGGLKLEHMPFQHDHHPGTTDREDFLSFYTWPVDPKTSERLNWLTLPVIDKRWNKQQADKGGFIQEATGWKPGILQPFVALESLLQRGRNN